MAQKIYTLPTLSTSGLLVSPKHIMERLFLYFRYSSKKQSSIYIDGVTSYRYLEHMYNDSLDVMKEQTVLALETLYSRYFTGVEVEVDYGKLSEALYVLEVKISVTAEDGVEYTYNTRLDIDKTRDLSRW